MICDFVCAALLEERDFLENGEFAFLENGEFFLENGEFFLENGDFLENGEFCGAAILSQENLAF